MRDSGGSGRLNACRSGVATTHAHVINHSAADVNLILNLLQLSVSHIFLQLVGIAHARISARTCTH